jgi:ABC-type transport system involved in multi-copper enzyme maturation permease subunit
LACALPVIALATLLGGIDPIALSGAFLVTIGVAVLSCTLAMTLSVWGKKMHEVLMTTYAVLTLWHLLQPLGEYLLRNLGAPSAAGTWHQLKLTSPYYLVLAPYWEPGVVTLTGHVQFLGVCLITAALLTALAVARVRAVTIRQAGEGAKLRRPRRVRSPSRFPSRLGWKGPSLDDNPVFWREWHRKRPSWWMRLVWSLFAILGGVCSLVTLRHWFRSPNDELPAIVNGFQAAAGLLLLGIGSAASLSEERIRGSLDVLLATPLSTPTIVWGKWLGSFRSFQRLAILPIGLATCLAIRTGHLFSWVLLVALLLSNGAMITSLGLLMATRIPRLSRTVGGTVLIYVLLTVVWPFAIMMISRGADTGSTGLVMASPFFGIAFGTFVISGASMPTELREAIPFWMFFWINAQGIVAAALYRTAVASFDRCLGRMPE